MTEFVSTEPLAGRAPRGTGALSVRSAMLRRLAACDVFDLATCALIVTLVAVALATFRAYAISNDEGVQHHYGELIVAYYRSGLVDRSVFSFDNLYLYGGLFDIVAVLLSHVVPLDPYDLRHILCALTGIGGIAAAAGVARQIAGPRLGPRAGLLAALSLAVCGPWYGAMFNHTKDIPLAAAMAGAAFFLIRCARALPSPRPADVALLGLLTGAALGMRVIGLLMFAYAALAIVLALPRPLRGGRGDRQANLRFALRSARALLPAAVIAYVLMILAWPWAALAPLNPIRGLFAFSEFQYHIRTILAGQVYEMASVPRLYVPIYILVRVPLLTLAGAALAMAMAVAALPRLAFTRIRRAEIAVVATMAIFPLAVQVICHGPAFTGLRHFLFVVPLLAILAGAGLAAAVDALAARSAVIATGALAVIGAALLWDAFTLVRLHPYEYLFYNSMVGGLEGASRRYDTDYWVNIMPAAVEGLESYLTRTEHTGAVGHAPHSYTVAVCGERLSFEHHARSRLLQWIRMQRWEQADFFIAPTQMNCDRILDGKVIVAIQRMGVPIGYVKDRRGLRRPPPVPAS